MDSGSYAHVGSEPLVDPENFVPLSLTLAKNDTTCPPSNYAYDGTKHSALNILV